VPGEPAPSDATTTTLEFPYQRTTGPVLGAFLTGVRDGRLLGSRIGGRVLCPPMEYDPETAAPAEPDLVEVGPGGTVESWTWVAHPTAKHPFAHPFAFALVRLDGADTALVHAVDAGSIDAMSTGMRVAAQYAAERRGAITDVWFVPEAAARPQDIVPGPEPVTISEHLIGVTIAEHLTPHRKRFIAALLDGRILGQRSPVSGKVYVPPRGYDNLERVPMGEEDDVVVADTGAVSSFTVITPIQYHGQQETEPYIRASILLDGTDQAINQVDVRDIPPEDFRVGMRVRAVWLPPERRTGAGIDNRGAAWDGVIERWEPTGEPDDDPRRLQEYAF
jgi:uncharacterized OB-fold protein